MNRPPASLDNPPRRGAGRHPQLREVSWLLMRFSGAFGARLDGRRHLFIMLSGTNGVYRRFNSWRSDGRPRSGNRGSVAVVAGAIAGGNGLPRSSTTTVAKTFNRFWVNRPADVMGFTLVR